MAFTGQSKTLHILTGIFSLDILYLEGKSPLLMRNNQVNLAAILSETSKSSAFWDMCVNSNLKWLPLCSPNEAGELDGTSQWADIESTEALTPCLSLYVTQDPGPLLSC